LTSPPTPVSYKKLLEQFKTPATLLDVLTAFLLALLFWILPTPVDIMTLIQKKS